MRLRLLQQAAADQAVRLTAIAPDVVVATASAGGEENHAPRAALKILTDAATSEGALKRLHAEVRPPLNASSSS